MGAFCEIAWLKDKPDNTGMFFKNNFCGYSIRVDYEEACVKKIKNNHLGT